MALVNTRREKFRIITDPNDGFGRCAYVAESLLSHFDLRFSFFMPFQALEMEEFQSKQTVLIYIIGNN